MKSHDKIKAKPGTAAAIMSEGQIGIVMEVRDPKGYSGNNSNNLVRWGTDEICCGFHPEDVEVVI